MGQTMENDKFRKNDIVTVTIEDIGNDGEGIGKVDGFTLFVKDAVIGDTVMARITKCKKNYGYARVEKVITPSSFRVEPKCRFSRQCGGCQIQAVSYDRQLLYKQDKVRGNLVRIGGFAPELIDAVSEPIIGMAEPWHYRNKAQYPVGYDKNGNLVTGFYAGRTHDIIANTDCALGAPENHIILETILNYMRENHVTAYRETEGTGLVRHILIRTGFQSGEIMVCIVINGKALPAEELLVEKLRGLRFPDEVEKRGYPTDPVKYVRGAVNDTGQDHTESEVEALHEGQDTDNGQRPACKRMASISISINQEKTNVIMGKEIRVLWGQDRIHDTLGGISFAISPLSFYQVNPVQTEKLYGLALEYAGLTGKETVWDLYCGIGTISLFMAQRAKQVYGVEVVPEAIADAGDNARSNGISNVQFFVGKAEEMLPGFYEEKTGEILRGKEPAIGNGKEECAQDNSGRDKSASEAERMRHPDVIVVDPPRKGCDEKCLETMLAMRPERIVYVSCDSATLSRDLKVLCEGGYELKRVRAVDQFGHSVHVEVIIMMQYCGKEKN